jgi:hypothetical protein
MGGSARIIFFGRRYDGRRIDGAPTLRIPQGAGGTGHHLRARTEGRKNLEEPAAALELRAVEVAGATPLHSVAPRPVLRQAQLHVR